MRGKKERIGKDKRRESHEERGRLAEGEQCTRAGRYLRLA
jgi:hypothetical protein